VNSNKVRSSSSNKRVNSANESGSLYFRQSIKVRRNEQSVILMLVGSFFYCIQSEGSCISGVRDGRDDLVL
jgi:hypothetical protein